MKMLKFLSKKCEKCSEKEKKIHQLLEENYALKSQKIPVDLLEKEVAYWKEKALNFKKFHT